MKSAVSKDIYTRPLHNKSHDEVRVMIIYEATKTELISNVTNELLVERLYISYQEKIGRTSKQEITSKVIEGGGGY